MCAKREGTLTILVAHSERKRQDHYLELELAHVRYPDGRRHGRCHWRPRWQRRHRNCRRRSNWRRGGSAFDYAAAPEMTVRSCKGIVLPRERRPGLWQLDSGTGS
jgi:hypothetical protein